MSSAFDTLDKHLKADKRTVDAPRRGSFKEFLLNDARVPDGKGGHCAYTFEGREAMEDIVDIIDLVLGSHTGQPLADAEMGVAGGAQWGKTILELHLAAYMTGCHFKNFGLYLPDDDLVQGIVDTKLRPDVIDQIEWFAEMCQVGKAVNKSGKAVNRKGAFLVTDGERQASGMIRGLGKVPTSFSMDAAAMDEVDDIQPKMAKFVKGRLTASKLRFILKIGTQRVHGRGMNKAWKDGSQGVMLFTCPNCEQTHNLEEAFPQILRHAINGQPNPNDPQLTYSADFRRVGDEAVVSNHDPLHHYYIACPDCGAALDRRAPHWEHRKPERIKLRNWTQRVSQLGIDAIDLSQIVAHWTKAVVDPEEMIVFRCDRLALPQSTSQALTPEVLDRSHAVEIFDLAPTVAKGCAAYGGLDMGDRCWFLARETGRRDHTPEEIETGKRIIGAEQIAAANVVGRASKLFYQLGLTALFIDQRPLVNEARTLAMLLNGLAEVTQWPKAEKDSHISFPSGLVWDGSNSRWQNLRCAVVRFDKKKLGAGVSQGLDIFEEDGQTKFVPLIECNRFETIDRVVREFLTPKENVVDLVSGNPRQQPAMRLPRRTLGAPPILELLDSHIISGSEREKDADGSMADYVDGCENHFLLSNGYSALAELIVRAADNFNVGPIYVFQTRQSDAAIARSDRSVEG